MKMTEIDKDKDGAALEPWFAAMREAGNAAPGDDLVARVLADAGERHPLPALAIRRSDRPGWRVRLRAVMDELGGWPAVAGLATSALAGVWIGVAAPDPLTSLTQEYLDGSGEMGVVDVLTAEFFAADEGAL